MLRGTESMFKKSLTLVVCCLLINMAAPKSTYGNTKPEKETLTSDRVKASIAKLGVGPESKVSVKLSNNKKLKGYVSDISEDHFVVTDPKTGASTRVPYGDVTQVKGRNNLKGETVIFIVGIAAIIIIGVLAGRAAR